MLTKLLQTLGITKARDVMSEATKEEVVRIPSFPYQNIYGALGIQTSKSQIDWERCRDRFQTKTDTNPVESFLFYHKDGTGDNVIKFLKTFEAACNCPLDQCVTFKKTTNKNVLFVGLSEWWKYRVRRSLLTALLRCGQNFTTDTGDGFQQALNSEYYLASTKDAVEKFLAGHTAIKMQKNISFPGWYAFFNGKSKDQIEKCLVRLKRKRKESVEAQTGELAPEPAAVREEV